MKSYCPILALILSLALAGCHWGLYSATAEIQLRPRFVTPIEPLSPDGSGKPPFAAEIESLQSDDLLLPVIRNLNLSSIWAKRFQSDHPVLSDNEALDHMHTVLKIELLPGTSLVKITAYSEVPKEAADIANAFVDVYKALRDREETENYERGMDAFRDQIAQQQKVVEDSKAASAKLPNDVNARRELDQQQALFDALNVRLKQVIADEKIMESPVRIISRAVAPPE